MITENVWNLFRLEIKWKLKKEKKEWNIIAKLTVVS